MKTLIHVPSDDDAALGDDFLQVGLALDVYRRRAGRRGLFGVVRFFQGFDLLLADLFEVFCHRTRRS